MKSKIIFFALMILIISCENKKSSSSSDENVDSTELLKLADSLELKQSEYDDLIDSVNTLNRKSDLFYRKIHIQKKEIDRLKDENKIFADVISKLEKKEEKAVLSKQEKAIQNLVFKMHSSWANLVKSKDPNDVLQYFNDKYLVSRISIDKNDSASVSRFSHDDFKDYIEDTILAEKGLSVEFADVDFLDIEIKDDAYFNVAYKCVMGTYKNDRLETTNSLLVTITGKNIEGTWGISSYSWVNFSYGMD